MLLPRFPLALEYPPAHEAFPKSFLMSTFVGSSQLDPRYLFALVSSLLLAWRGLLLPLAHPAVSGMSRYTVPGQVMPWPGHPHACAPGGVEENVALRALLLLRGQLKGCSWNCPCGGSLPVGLLCLLRGKDSGTEGFHRLGVKAKPWRG